MADPNRYLAKPSSVSDHGKRYEGHAAKSMGAKLRPASGAMLSAKGDMTRGTWLIEAKSTTNASMPIQLGWLVKITEEALATGKNPALLISFVLPDGRPKPNCDSEWVCMPKQKYLELVDGD